MDFENNIPIYQQIVDIIKTKIVSGEMKSNDKVKPVREMAAEMGVNPNTMQKALATLETELLLYTERTSGRYVTNNIQKIEELKKSMLLKEIEKFFETMKKMGYEKEYAVEIIIKYCKEESMI